MLLAGGADRADLARRGVVDLVRHHDDDAGRAGLDPVHDLHRGLALELGGEPRPGERIGRRDGDREAFEGEAAQRVDGGERRHWRVPLWCRAGLLPTTPRQHAARDLTGT